MDVPLYIFLFGGFLSPITTAANLRKAPARPSLCKKVGQNRLPALLLHYLCKTIEYYTTEIWRNIIY